MSSRGAFKLLSSESTTRVLSSTGSDTASSINCLVVKAMCLSMSGVASQSPLRRVYHPWAQAAMAEVACSQTKATRDIKTTHATLLVQRTVSLLRRLSCLEDNTMAPRDRTRRRVQSSRSFCSRRAHNPAPHSDQSTWSAGVPPGLSAAFCRRKNPLNRSSLKHLCQEEDRTFPDGSCP